MSPNLIRELVAEAFGVAAKKIQAGLTTKLLNADSYTFHIPLAEASLPGTTDVYILAPTDSDYATEYRLKVKLLPNDADANIPAGTEYMNSTQSDTAPDPNGGPFSVVAAPGYSFYKFSVTVPGSSGAGVLLQFLTYDSGGSPAKLVRVSRLVKNGS